MKTSVVLGPITQNLGAFKIPLILLLILVLTVIVLLVVENFIRSKKDPFRYKQGLSALLVLGSLSAVVGMLGQIMGIWHALAAILEAADINPTIVIEGLQASFGTTYFGFIIFFIAFIAWLFFSYDHKKKVVT
ncbi:MAG: MotA/TolQ/ExbB proton channel family protein [Cytophagales bacterium]|nr:MotA/TolQ/ExbB proton channel family protein [Cytophagales bacterium]